MVKPPSFWGSGRRFESVWPYMDLFTRMLSALLPDEDVDPDADNLKDRVDRDTIQRQHFSANPPSEDPRPYV